MDTAAYLTKHGWLGTGHSLHPKGHGIKKPLLIREKLDSFGVGKKKNDIHADQWWARMFDSTLKDLQIGTHKTLETPEASSATSSRTYLYGLSHRQANIIGTGGLYGCFVKGESLVGTIEAEAEAVKQLQTDDSTELQCEGNNDRKAKSRRSHKIDALQAKRKSRSSFSPCSEDQKEARRLQRKKRRENAKGDQSRRKARKKVQDGDNER